MHRRTVWFVDKTFFVLLDEAIGEAEGALDLHFQLAPGEVHVDTDRHLATTTFDDANVLVWMDPTAPLSMHVEEGWFAWKYGHRRPRTAIRFRHSDSAPAAFLTVLCPYQGTELPKCSAKLPPSYVVGADQVQLRVEASGKVWELTRDLARNEASATERESGK
jgi:heparan-sulfate lyase